MLIMMPVPIKRYGTPAEIAGAVALLCGPDAGYITGDIIHVTGGLQWMGQTVDMAPISRWT